MEKVLSVSAASREASALMNIPSSPYSVRPIHLAYRSKNYNLLRLLVNEAKVNLNAIDEISGMTVLHEAAEQGELEAINILCEGKDRLDLLVEKSKIQTTVVDYAINTLNLSLLSIFLDIRPNDVIERVISNKNNNDTSLLMQLETTNMELAGDAVIISIDDTISNDNENASPSIDNTKANNDDELNDSFACMDLNKNEIKYKLGDDEVRINKMRKHDEIMKILLLRIQESGLLDANSHMHTCFYNGNVYSEFLLGYINDYNNEIEMQ
jgi:hypothetical protein